MFTSYYRDYEASGNDYAQARTYVGGLGRFSSPDPISGSTSDPQSLNRYSYVRNMPVMLTDPFGTCPPVVQNHDSDDSQDAKSGGPSDPALAEGTEADPQGAAGGTCQSAPWYFTLGGGGGSGALGGGFGGGGVSIDGGETFDPGDGGWGLTGIGTDPFSILNAAFSVTGYETVDNPDCLNGDCPGGVGEETITVPVYGNLGILSLLAGWTIDPKDLILKVTRDCFNKGAGRREVTYQLATQSGSPLVGTYNITEQQSDTSVTPPNPWGQSSNDPRTDGNTFNDILQPGLLSSQTVKSTQYFLVSPGSLNIAQWVPISRPGQALSKFNTIVMKGPLSSNPNTVKINGKAASPCGMI